MWIVAVAIGLAPIGFHWGGCSEERIANHHSTSIYKRLKISLKILANFSFIFSLFTPPRTFSTLFSFIPPMIPIICFFFFPSFFVNYIQQLFRLEPIQSFVSKHKIPSTGGCRNILKVFFTQHSRTISEISFYLKGLWEIYQNTSLILLLLKFCFIFLKYFTKIGLSRTFICLFRFFKF